MSESENESEVEIARLRFLSSAVMDAFSVSLASELATTYPSMPASTSPDMLRTFLRHALPLLESVPCYQELARQVRQALGEP